MEMAAGNTAADSTRFRNYKSGSPEVSIQRI